MNKYVVQQDIHTALFKQPRPTLVALNRVEGRPRKTDFSRALKAEVRDPLWMLSRQWQFGEFGGEDAASPVTAKIAWRTDAVTEVTTAGSTSGYSEEVPLEAEIEALPIPWRQGDRAMQGQLRMSLGRRWRKMIAAVGHGGFAGAFAAQYAFESPTAGDPADFHVTAHAGTWQFQAAVSGNAIDGGALFEHIDRGGNASDGLGLVEPALSEIDALGQVFADAVRKQFFVPDREDPAWQKRNLEYNAQLSAPDAKGGAALSAPQYRGGRLDWFHFDATEAQGASGGSALQSSSFLPVALQFEGMPHTRHWAFEEGAANFGDIAPDTTDIAKLLLIEFGLVYANDWFLLPMELPTGSLTEIAGLTVTNVFGERIWIDRAIDEAGPANSWQMFTLADSGRVDKRLFLPPTTPNAHESRPEEQVHLLRDEVSNMVWGLEKAVPMADGVSRQGSEVGRELHDRFQAHIGPVPEPTEENEARVVYRLMTDVAEHWIPFLPIRVTGSDREVELQRAAMPRLLDGDASPVPDKVRPRTWLLREGLDASTPEALFIAEEEVERAGTQVTAKWQRCRWYNGKVVTWYSRERRVGRGEGHGGLAFDVLEPKT